MPGTWPRGDLGRGILLPGVHRQDERDMVLDWLVCVSKACFLLSPLLPLRIGPRWGSLSSSTKIFEILKHHNIQQIKNRFKQECRVFYIQIRVERVEKALLFLHHFLQDASLIGFACILFSRVSHMDTHSCKGGQEM